MAFSCKRRGWCPSCMGRRMVDTAARLVDEVLPQVPVRQFVLSLPFEIRYRLAYDGKLISGLLAVFLRVVTAWYVRQARGQGYRGARCGSVTFVQRFGSSINLNPHFHVLFLDGVYVPAAEGGAPVFVAAPPLADEDVQKLVETPPSASYDCCSAVACWMTPWSMISASQSRCRRRFQRHRCRGSLPLASAPASECGSSATLHGRLWPLAACRSSTTNS